MYHNCYLQIEKISQMGTFILARIFHHATYGATAGAGLAGAIILGGAGIAMAKRKEKQR